MAVTFFKVPINAGVLGAIGPADTVRVMVRTNVPEGVITYAADNWIFASGAVFKFKGVPVEVDLPTKVGANPVDFEFELTVEITRSGERPQMYGPFYKPAPTSTADAPLAEWVGASSVPASWMTAATASLQTYVDDAESAKTGAEAAAALVSGTIITDLGTTDGQTAALVTTPASLTATALSTTIATGISSSPVVAKRSLTTATQFLPPIGAVVHQQEHVMAYLTLSRDGSKIIARDMSSSGGRTPAWSADGGTTWTRCATPDAVQGPQYAWTTASGTWLVLCGNKLYRSTDDGVAWTLVLTMGTEETILHNGLTQTANGNLYAGAYASSVAGTTYASGAPVYTSTNDGGAWTVHSSFPSTMKGASGTSAIRHIHGLLAIGNDLWCATGDSPVESGIWKYEGGGWVRKSPLDTSGNGHRFCAVALNHRAGYLYWALDTNADDPGLMMKAPVGDLAAWEELADLPTSSYYTTTMPDGTILYGGSIEVGTGGYQDDSLRIWAIDMADVVHEVWSGPLHKSGSGNRPIGALISHPTDGSFIWSTKMMLDARNPAAMAAASFRGSLRRGVATAPETIAAGRATPAVWQKKGATVDPSTSSATMSTLESVDVDLKGKTVLVLWSAVVSSGTASARVTLGPAIDNGTVVNADQRGVMASGTWQEFTVSGQAILTTSVAGKHTVDLKWSTSTGTATANNIKRSIIVLELPS